MRIGGFLDVLRAFLAHGIRSVGAWMADATCVLANVVDPAMPESIWRPREWLWRLWSRGQHTDLHPPPGA